VWRALSNDRNGAKQEAWRGQPELPLSAPIAAIPATTIEPPESNQTGRSAFAMGTGLHALNPFTAGPRIGAVGWF